MIIVRSVKHVFWNHAGLVTTLVLLTLLRSLFSCLANIILLLTTELRQSLVEVIYLVYVDRWLFKNLSCNLDFLRINRLRNWRQVWFRACFEKVANFHRLISKTIICKQLLSFLNLIFLDLGRNWSCKRSRDVAMCWESLNFIYEFVIHSCVVNLRLVDWNLLL